jgi:hypothetical protein
MLHDLQLRPISQRRRHGRVAAAALLVAALAAGAAAAAPRRAACTITGTADRDVLRGTPRADVLCSGAGADTIFAGGGHDTVLGGRDSDTIYGGGGRDRLYGGSGSDAIYGGDGRDRVFGGSGNDVIFTRDGERDIVDGGAGADRALTDRRLDRVRAVPVAFQGARPETALLLAAGDIADCTRGAEKTAPLLDAYPSATVGTLGDHAYDSGTPEEFQRCYAPTWGRAKNRTRPTPGNHEYATPGATGYFRYFGPAAGEAGKGYYSYNLGSWHIVVLNSNCAHVEGGCGEQSPQVAWLRADLAAHPRLCTLAYWHDPRWSSGTQRSQRQVDVFWRILSESGADLILSASHHAFERFAPQNADGVADPVRGMRAFVIGTGGASLGRFRSPVPNSEVRESETHGVLKVALAPNGYAWEFLPGVGERFTDSGTGACH